MGEGWSLSDSTKEDKWAWVKDRKDLIPSSGVVTHLDSRMSLSPKDIDPCNVTHRDWRIPPELVRS